MWCGRWGDVYTQGGDLISHYFRDRAAAGCLPGREEVTDKKEQKPGGLVLKMEQHVDH